MNLHKSSAEKAQKESPARISKILES